MSNTIKQCKKCNPNPQMYSSLKFDENDKDYLKFWTEFIDGWQMQAVCKNESYNKDFENNICPFCKSKLIDTMLTRDDFHAIGGYSNYNRDLLLAMIELRKMDVIEFETKMQPFRQDANRRKEEQERRTQEYFAHKDTLKCPECGSSNIQTINRGFSILTGFIGSGSPRNICQKCGFKWKPGE